MGCRAAVLPGAINLRNVWELTQNRARDVTQPGGSSGRACGPVLEKSGRRGPGMGLPRRVRDSEAEGRHPTVAVSTGQRKRTPALPQGPLGVVDTEDMAPSSSPVFLRTQASTGSVKQGRDEGG